MLNYTREQLNERYKNLPKDVQEAIIGVETADIIRQIGDEKKMMIDKIGDLAEEISLVLLGFTHPSQFVSHLSERLGIEKPVAKEIAEQVNTRIFFPIRENLKKIHGLREEEYEKEEAPTLAESEVGVPTPDTLGWDVGKEIKPPETPISQQTSEEIPKDGPWESPTSIFETKTKEGVFHAPAEITEKKTPTLTEVGAPTPPKAGVEVDPYREQT